MNIFVTDNCPVKSAKFLDNKRVVKMCLETAQMLCTAISSFGVNTPYKPTHRNHPCNVWVRESKENWLWLYQHGIALCEEYTRRYHKTHKCEGIIRSIYKHNELLPQKGRTKFVNCAANNSVNVSFKHVDDVLEAYKLYLNRRWELDIKPPTWNVK
jgi:hypothetical protein